ncbi:hypothetical protein ARMGADRAFT_218575 [Armillaria gallica]|uniref:Uncharacterized protein n=1 Tax=Armillaria gallica TaxID=47427 RepID=A0A2H3DI68_ARMGA|nr:hypothetical protein ARMGADRAFT_218575 [Armillaria gallica]
MEERTILTFNRIKGCSSCTQCQTWCLHRPTMVNKSKAASYFPSQFDTVLGTGRSHAFSAMSTNYAHVKRRVKRCNGQRGYAFGAIA